MGLKQKMKQVPVLYNGLLTILNSLDYFNRRFRNKFPSYQITPYWRERIDMVKASPDNKRIARDPHAGEIRFDHQVMHNGLKISLGSYYDYGNTHLLKENFGVHEPQEEVAFAEVLRHMPEGAVMMELGSYWAFYSLWFATSVKGGQCYMVEPDPHKMNFGKLNFRRNGARGNFTIGFVGDTVRKGSVPVVTVDHLIQHHHIQHVHILHSDIQGYELAMLRGASNALKTKSIDYFFISTHSNELHNQCIDFLVNTGYDILCECNLDRSYSVDGLIVARRKDVGGPATIAISQRPSLR